MYNKHNFVPNFNQKVFDKGQDEKAFEKGQDLIHRFISLICFFYL